MQTTQAFRNASTRRSAFFNELKPCCVELAKALRRSDPSTSPHDAAASAIALTDKLYGLLEAQVAHDASVLDPALGDYVFFPLLPVFQGLGLHQYQYPARLVENATKCLRVLIEHAWKTALPRESAQRFLILLTQVVAGPGASAQPTTTADRPEETLVEGYRALAALFRTAGGGTTPASPLADTNVVPALAHTVTVVLAGVTDSVVPAVQLAALDAVAALYTHLRDQEALAAFLPGTVSSLARLHSLPGAHKLPRRVVVRSLAVLQTVLVQTLGDLHTRRLVGGGPAPAEPTPAEPAPADPSPTESAALKMKLDSAWLTATAAQVQVALASVLKLRNHEAEEVRDAVQRLCIALLDECHASLAGSASLLVESAIITSDAHSHSHSQGNATTLVDLAILYPELADTVKATAYAWATGLPRALQASDEAAKQRALRHLQQALATLEALHADSRTLQNTLAGALRDSVVTLVRGAAAAAAPGGQKAVVNEAADVEVALLQTGGVDASVSSPGQAVARTEYAPVLLSLGSQRGTRAALRELIQKVGPPAQQAQLAAELLADVRDGGGLDQAAAFWLAWELVQASLRGTDEVDQFLDLGSSESEAEAVLEELFSFSVSVLAAHSDVSAFDVSALDVSSDVSPSDWRVAALALEVTAFAAARAGTAFRPELIDVLYPVATYLGSAQPRLRAHAVVTLNALAAACGFDSVSALIVDNVDYLLNAVTLRLNTLDVSPASTQVLRMMLRLAGARLVPFLDDVVAALFAALDNYHGYAAFVEGLFGVLGEVVQQTVQAPALLEAGGGNGKKKKGTTTTRENHRKRPLESLSTDDLVAMLRRRAKRRREGERVEEGREDDDEFARRPAGERHPQEPWTSEADALLRKREEEGKEGDDDDDDDDDEESDNKKKTDLNKEGDVDDDNKPPPTPAYALLARITALTQHYLTAPTPTLRRALLALLATVAPALAHDPDAFLPLVHAVWPVAVARLYDGEPYVVVAACGALAALCASAGDFLATRVKDEWRARLGGWCARAKAAAAAAQTRGGGQTRGAPPPPRKPKTPSVIHIHQRETALRSIASRSATTGAGAETQGTSIVVPFRGLPGGRENNDKGNDDGGGAQLVQVSSSTTSSTSTPSSTPTPSMAVSGLGRFAQAAQVWTAVAGLLTAVVQHVRVDDAVLDEVLDLLLEPVVVVVPAQKTTPHTTTTTKPLARPLLSPADEQHAREALNAVNADAVWLAQYRYSRMYTVVGGGVQAEWTAPTRAPELAGVSFSAV